MFVRVFSDRNNHVSPPVTLHGNITSWGPCSSWGPSECEHPEYVSVVRVSFRWRRSAQHETLVTIEQRSNWVRFKWTQHVVDNLLTSSRTYSRARSDGVPKLATIDRRQSNPVYVETTAVIHQATGTPNKFARNALPRALCIRLTNASPCVQLHDNVFKGC